MGTRNFRAGRTRKMKAVTVDVKLVVPRDIAVETSHDERNCGNELRKYSERVDSIEGELLLSYIERKAWASGAESTALKELCS